MQSLIFILSFLIFAPGRGRPRKRDRSPSIDQCLSTEVHVHTCWYFGTFSNNYWGITKARLHDSWHVRNTWSANCYFGISEDWAGILRKGIQQPSFALFNPVVCTLDPFYGRTRPEFIHNLRSYDCQNTTLEERVEKAKLAYIDTVLQDLKSRFADMKRESSKLDIFHRLLDLSVDEVRNGSVELAALYGENSLILENEMNMARAVANASGLKFKTFQELAKFLLLKLPYENYKLMHKFLSIVLVLPFSTADCERAFSKMNTIQTAKRNRLGDILRARPQDLNDMAKDVAHRVSRDKKSKFWASERYLMSIV